MRSLLLCLRSVVCWKMKSLSILTKKKNCRCDNAYYWWRRCDQKIIMADLFIHNTHIYFFLNIYSMTNLYLYFIFYSVNCITTLADIQNCKNLQELYIRKNKIPDLNEVCWLRELTKLKNLWLEENPCCNQTQSEL